MKVINIPFYLTLLACLLPPLAAYLNSKAIAYIPEVVLAIFYLFFLTTANGERSRTRLAPGWLLLLILIALHAMLQLFTYGGHGSMGATAVVLLTVIFIQLLSGPMTRISPFRIAQQLSILYSLHIVVLFAELALRMAGSSDTLVHLFGAATEVTKYKTYNSATFFRYIGFDESFWGLNGLLLGSQSAGQMMVCAVIFFAPCYYWSALDRRSNKFLFLAATIGAICAINMTSAIIFGLIVCLLIYGVPLSRLGTRFIRMTAPIVVILFSHQIGGLIFFRIRSEYDLGVYLDAYLPPILVWGEMTWFERLFGLGRYIVRAESSDFGLAALVNQIGAVLFVALGVTLFGIVYGGLREAAKAVRAKYSGQNTEEREPWAWLAVVNALLVIIYTGSLIHYTPAIELGGRELFALHCAVTYVATMQLRELGMRCSARADHVSPPATDLTASEE